MRAGRAEDRDVDPVGGGVAAARTASGMQPARQRGRWLTGRTVTGGAALRE